MHDRHRSNSQHSLPRRLAVIRGSVLAFALALAIGLVLYSYFDRSRIEIDAGERLRVLAQVMAQNVEIQLGSLERQMTTMRRLIHVGDDNSSAHFDPFGRDLLLDWCRSDPSCMDLLVVDHSGEIVEWTGPGTPPVVADREYVSHHFATPDSGTYVGIPQLSRVHQGRWFFAVSRAERDADGKVKYIYVSIRDLFHSFDYGDVVRRTPGASFAVVSTGGEVYAREPNREKHMGKVIPQVEQVLSSVPGGSRLTRIESRLDGADRMIVTLRLARYPLYVAATQDMDQVLRHWRHRVVVKFVLWLLLIAIAVNVGRRLIEDVRLQDYLASIDGLTGILNRRALMTEARRQEERRVDAGGLGLMMIDVDHFKRINDRFGHMVGDEVLRQVVSALRMSSRGSDVLGRYGGEEFLMLLPGADESRLAKVGEKLRAAVEAIPSIEFAGRDGYPETLTISVGATVLRPDGGSLDSAIALADHALYQAKHAGRNRVVVSGLPAGA